MAISIVHNTASRLRLWLPRLADDADFAAHLMQQVQALAMVTEARINPPARSLIVHYQPGWSVVDLCIRIDRAAARAATLSLTGAPRPALAVYLPSATLSGVGWVLLVLGGSVAFAGVLLLLKVLSRTDSSHTSIAYNALLLTPLTLVPALAVWTAPTLGELAILALIAGLAIIGQACMANALEKADATAVLPADFAQLLWASGLGYLLFREVPDLWTWLGALLIFAGVLYAAYGEGEPEAIPDV